MKNKSALLLFIIAAWIFPAKSGAESSISPALTLREEYNDNIELRRDNRIDDFITTVNPSLAISMKSRLFDLLADYGFNLRFYAQNSDHNEMQQRAKFASKLTLLPERLFLKVSDDYERVPIDQRNQVALDNLFVNLTDINHLTVNPYLELPITSKLKFTAGYTYQNKWYDDPAGDDSDDHSATAALNKQFGERLSVNGSYAYRWHRPSKTNEYDSQTVSVGAATQVTPKFSLNGSVGHVKTKYKDDFRAFYVVQIDYVQNEISINRVMIDVAPKDNSSLIWNAQANYSFTELLSLGVGYSRSFADSVNEGSVKSDNLKGSISYGGVVPITVSGFMTRGKYIDIGREDRSTGVIVNVSIPISRFTCRLDGTYTHNNFLPDNEKIDRYGFRIGIDYRIAIATLGIGYTWNQSDSSFPERDYYNNILFAQAKFTF